MAQGHLDSLLTLTDEPQSGPSTELSVCVCVCVCARRHVRVGWVRRGQWRQFLAFQQLQDPMAGLPSRCPFTDDER